MLFRSVLDSKNDFNSAAWRVMHYRLFEALRARLAQPEPDPVAVWELQEGGWDTIADHEWMESLPIGTKLYTAPPQREWQGLTDEEYKTIRYGHDENGEPNVEYELFDDGEYGMEVNIYVDDFYRAIEAKLKEKNSA